MDFTKFVSLLDKKSLYFCQADILQDKFEMSIFPETVKVLEKTRSKEEIREIENRANKLRKSIYLNCWTMNDNESFAMWKVFLNNQSDGVAIKSSVAKLKQSIIGSQHSIEAIKVNYQDVAEDIEKEDIDIIRTKRSFYKYEQELRVFIRSPYGDASSNLLSPFNEGLNVNIDLENLIEKIFISPFSNEISKRSVYSIIEKFYPILGAKVDFSGCQQKGR